MLPQTIKEIIKEEAEKTAHELYHNWREKSEYVACMNGAISGLTLGYEECIRFLEWKEKMGYNNYMSWEKPAWGKSLQGNRLTTSDLLTEYLKQKAK